MKYKYITFVNGTDDAVIIFPDRLQHSDVWKLLNISTPNLIGAGFIDGNGKPYGKSVSLDKKTHKDDERIIKSYYKQTGD